MKKTLKKSRTRITSKHAVWTTVFCKLKRSVASALVLTLGIAALAFFSGGNLDGSTLRSEIPTYSPAVISIQTKYEKICLGGADGFEKACNDAVTALTALTDQKDVAGAKVLIPRYEKKVQDSNRTTNQAATPTATLKDSSTSLPVTLIPKNGSIIGGDKSKCGKLVQHFSDGQFQIWELPCYVQYLSEVALYFAGGICVLFIIIGGYKYMIGSLSDDKEGGKKTLQYALTGFTVTLLAWTIVNIWQVYVTTGEYKPSAEQALTSDETTATDAQTPGEAIVGAGPAVPITVGDLKLECPDGKKIDAVMAYIVANEGAKNNKYIINGNPTIGVGHDCKTNPKPICSKNSITNAEMLELYAIDYKDHVGQAKAAVPGFDGLDAVRQAVVIDLTFNQGRGWVAKFPRFIAALSAKNYEEAYKELTLNGSKNGDSLYLKQVGARARRNATLIRSGDPAPLEKQALTNKLGIQMLCSNNTETPATAQ